MWVSSLAIAVILLLTAQSVHCRTHVEVVGKLLLDIFACEQSLAVISARVCWSNDDRIAIIKQLPFMIQFLRTSTDLQRINSDHINKVHFFIDMNCSDSRSFLASVDEKYFAHPFRWIILNENPDYLSSFAFLPDNNVIVASDVGDAVFDLVQVYKIEKHHQRLIVERYGRWKYDTGIEDMRLSRVLSERRRNLMGKHFKGSIIISNNESLNHLDDYRDRHIDTISKATYIIIKNLLHSLNASIEYVISDAWGDKDPKTEIYSGMTGHLQRKEVDIGGTPLILTPDRVPLVEYLSMTSPTQFYFIFRPPPLSYVENIFYLPFTTIVWYCTICLVILAATILFLSYHYGSDHLLRRYTRSDFILLAVGTVCQTGDQSTPRVISGRITLFVFCIAMSFIYTSYTANIVALLQSTTKSIRTIDDLLHSSIEIGVEDTPYTRYHIPNVVESTKKRFYEQEIKDNPSAFVNLTYGIERMRRGMYAMHIEMGVGSKQIEDTFLEHEKCGLVEIPFIEQIDPWFVIQKHSPYKEILKTSLLRLREWGIPTRENMRLFAGKPVCSTNGQSFDSVRFIDCFAVWFVLGYGAALSVIILTLEVLKEKIICLYNRKKSQ